MSDDDSAKALALLEARGYSAWKDVERLLGWPSKRCNMPAATMAKRLGLKPARLRYILSRDQILTEQRRRRSAGKEAAQTALKRTTSRSLRFSIALPKHWRVITDTPQADTLGRDLVAYLHAAGRKETTNAERLVLLEEMQRGLFQAAPVNDPDGVEIEVVRLRLPRTYTAAELYEIHKWPPELVPWGNRPKQGMMVDGLPGVVYYHCPDVGDAVAERLVFFDLFLVEGLEGWVLTGSCLCGAPPMAAFKRYRPLFKRILGSFQRIRGV